MKVLRPPRDVRYGDGWNRRFRALRVVVWSAALALVLGAGAGVVYAEVRLDQGAGSSLEPLATENDVGLTQLWLPEELSYRSSPTRDPFADIRQRSKEQFTLLPKPPLADEFPGFPAERLDADKREAPRERFVQFQLPEHKKRASEKAAEPPVLKSYLELEYSYGSESEISYRKNSNLNNHVNDESLLVIPEINGFITYRPFDWLEASLEAILDVEIPAIEQAKVVLPNGDIQKGEGTKVSITVDQAFITIKKVIAPFQLSMGRKNFEDDRHWLYDTALDVGLLSWNWSNYRVELSAGREAYVDWNFSTPEGTDRINTYMLYGEYRGIEDIKFAGYTIFRDDLDVSEGQPVLLGLRSVGSPTLGLSYWADIAYMTGYNSDNSQRFSGFGIDIGGTYRFLNLPFVPNFTLGFAYGSGNNPSTGTDTEFRQTGLQSNETRFAGLTEFKIYGEALDPQLTNIMIFTAGLGFRPTRNISVDLVYHRYWLDEFAEELRNSAVTALMNQAPGQKSKDVGDAFDLVVGFRNVFGLRRLGIDLRAGWFFPGKAFSVQDGNGQFESGDTGATLTTKFWW